ncbi:hypothetical protein RJ641_011486 [Dillenia turbinata]|uniref:Uncharacterized protein n=1 Tax=Dillenia turbinata TaxID=194707 RepID=A0AAN8V5N6_9MAGN
MRVKGVKKKPGCSWVEVNKRIHVLIKEVYAYLDEMLLKLRQAGYVPNLRWALVRDDGAREAENETRLGHPKAKSVSAIYQFKADTPILEFMYSDTRL